MNSFNIKRWFKMILAMSLLFIFIVSPFTAAKTHLIVLVPYFPPYTLENDDKISGIGIELADEVFKQANINVRYRILPNYAKALHEMQQGRGDALLLASQNSERDNIAVFSKPLMFNRWCWYLLKDTPLNPHESGFKQAAKISSHFKTNTHKWLIENSYTVEPVMKIINLPHMLLRNRVDAVFIAELAFEEAIKQNDLKSSQFKKYVEIEKPFGIYISKIYLDQNPAVLNRVNKAIGEIITPM